MTGSLTLIIGVLALNVDWGLKLLVNAEVQQAADAAAKAGATRLAELATSLNDSDAASVAAAVRATAKSIGNANTSTGASLKVADSDVELGIWDDDTRQFTPVISPEMNAVRVTVERSPSKSNSIETSLARAYGIHQLTARRSSVARLDRPPAYALVGLEYFNSMGILTVDGSPLNRQGHIASNGDVSLNLLGLIGVTLIDGHVATRGDVKLPWLLNLTLIREGIQRPAKPFVLPAVSVQAPTRVNDNGLLGSLLSSDESMLVVGIRDLAPGTYNVRDFTILAGAVLRVRGPTTIYVRRNVSVLGSVLSLDNPENMKIRVVGDGPVTIAANVTLSADIYAPGSRAYIAAGVIYRGRLMARSIDILGTSFFFLRPDLPAPELGRARVTLMR